MKLFDNDGICIYPGRPLTSMSLSSENGSKFSCAGGSHFVPDKWKVLFGVCVIKDSITNSPEGAKLKIKCRHDDFVFVFVKHNNTITKYSLCVVYNSISECFEFVLMHPQALNTRVKNT